MGYNIVSEPQHGSFSGYAPALTYTPEEEYSGPDSFTFTVNDGVIDSEVATVSITITAVNLAPIAQGQELTVEMDQVLAIVLMATDTDSEVESLTYQIANQPQHGILSGTAPDLTYTPEAGYSGADSFTSEIVETSNTNKPKQPECLSLAWSPDGQTLFAGYSDNHIRVWQVSILAA